MSFVISSENDYEHEIATLLSGGNLPSLSDLATEGVLGCQCFCVYVTALQSWLER